MTTNNPTTPELNKNLPTPTNQEPAPFGDLLVETRDAIAFDGGDPFPSFGGPSVGRFTKDLEGIPFIFTSEAVLRMQPAKRLDDGRQIPEQEVAQAWIRVLDENGIPQAGELATLGGRYLVNQIRNATRDDLVGGGIFTVARNPRFKAMNGQNPYMIKRYEHGKDTPPVPWDNAELGGPFGLPANVQTRIAEIEAKGAVPPTYWTQPQPHEDRTGTPPESDMTRAEFIAKVSDLGYTVTSAMRALGVRSLAGLNLTTAYHQLEQYSMLDAQAGKEVGTK